MYATSNVEGFDTGNNPFSCYLCDDNFKDDVSLRKHVENCGKTFYCAKCNGNFKSKQNLEEHVVFVHDKEVHELKKPYNSEMSKPCAVCGKEFKSYDILIRHIEQIHH